MRYRFTGQFTHGRTSVALNGVTFEGREPSEVTTKVEWRFAAHPEFERVSEVEPEIEAPKRRGRKPKVQA